MDKGIPLVREIEPGLNSNFRETFSGKETEGESPFPSRRNPAKIRDRPSQPPEEDYLGLEMAKTSFPGLVVVGVGRLDKLVNGIIRWLINWTSRLREERRRTFNRSFQGEGVITSEWIQGNCPLIERRNGKKTKDTKGFIPWKNNLRFFLFLLLALD